MKLFTLSSVLLVLLGLGACAHTDQANGTNAQGQNQFYGEIKGGVESSHTH